MLMKVSLKAGEVVKQEQERWDKKNESSPADKIFSPAGNIKPSWWSVTAPMRNTICRLCKNTKRKKSSSSLFYRHFIYSSSHIANNTKKLDSSIFPRSCKTNMISGHVRSREITFLWVRLQSRFPSFLLKIFGFP